MDKSQEYHPELIPRRGEWVAWSLFILVAGVFCSLLVLKQTVSWLVPLLGMVFLFAALGISLGNWMDRHTRLRILDEGIDFTNGVRKVQLDWDQIHQVRVMPSTWGKKVRVVGEKAYFDFFTLGEVKYAGEVKGRTGFVQGEQILRHIILKSELEIVDQLDGSYYYARK